MIKNYQITKKESLQWAQTTLHIPGTVGTATLSGRGGSFAGLAAWLPLFGVKLMMRLQLGLGQAILKLVFLHIRRQLHGQRTYFLP